MKCYKPSAERPRHFDIDKAISGVTPLIVLVVQQTGLSVREIERQPPIAIDPNRPAAPIGAPQRMKLESWNVHIANDLSGFQGNQQHPQSFRLLRLERIVGRLSRLDPRCACPMRPNVLFCHLRQLICDRVPRCLQLYIDVFVWFYFRIIVEQARWHKP
jgi:hypothetical protein